MAVAHRGQSSSHALQIIGVLGVIGTIFSAVYPDGNLANKFTGVSTYNIPAGGGAMFELTIADEGTYPFVTHSFADASKGALGVIKVETRPQRSRVVTT